MYIIVAMKKIYGYLQINIEFIISGGDCMYTINPEMSFGQVVASYQKYVRETQKRGKEPVTFLHFLTGRC